MIYAHSWHRYVLTSDAVRERLGVDLDVRLNKRGAVDAAAVVPAFLNSISRQVYSYIYSCNTQNSVQEYLAAKHPAARPILRDAMLEQVGYVLMNGDVSKLSGIDIRKGMILDRHALRAAQIDPVARELLARPLDTATPALTYAGDSFMFYRAMELPAYETEGY